MDNDEILLKRYHNNGQITQLRNRVELLENQIDAIKNLFGITFTENGNISAESYTTHTHNYLDNDGSADNARTTEGVN